MCGLCVLGTCPHQLNFLGKFHPELKKLCQHCGLTQNRSGFFSHLGSGEEAVRGRIPPWFGNCGISITASSLIPKIIVN